MNLFDVRNVLVLDPWVHGDLGDRESLIWLEAEHVNNEILEAFTEEPSWFVLLVGSPEDVPPAMHDQRIEAILLSCRNEGHLARVEHEDDHSDGEEIGHLPLV